MTAYRVVTDPPHRSVVTATPADPYAALTVEAEPDRTVVVTVTSEDGSQVRAYRIELVRRPS